MNSLLKRQLRKYLPKNLKSNKELDTFLDAVNRSYNTSDEQFLMLQRAASLSSKELFDSNQKMPLEGDTHFKALKKNYAAGSELKGKTLGIIGFGRIGREVAAMAYGLGMKIVVADHNTEPVELTIPFADGQSIKTTITPADFDTVLTTADFISVHVSGAGKTLIGKAEIAKNFKTE